MSKKEIETAANFSTAFPYTQKAHNFFFKQKQTHYFQMETNIQQEEP